MLDTLRPRTSTETADPAFTRRLRKGDRDLFLAHLLRLDAASRRSRFAGIVSDEGVRAYAEGALQTGDVTIGLFVDGELRGVAELRFDGPDAAEGAFSLEGAWQGRGFGQRLFGELLDDARRRGVVRLTLQCLRENAAMQRIARRFRGVLSFADGEVVAEIHRPEAEAAASRALARLASETGASLSL